MGLTIHYALKLEGRRTSAHPQARKIIAKLRQAALDLPIQEVSELFDLSGLGGCRLKSKPMTGPSPSLPLYQRFFE
jgi:hypothetical protein